MNRRLLARLAAVSLVPAVTSCGHDSPTTPATRGATLAVHATTLDSLSNGTVDVVVSYRQQGGQLVAVHATPASIALDGAGMASKQLDVDLAACLADSQRADAEQRGCPLVVELALRDAFGAEIDRQQVALTSRVSPGQLADVPAVALANAGNVTIAAPASTSLHPGDKIQLTATVRMPNGSVNDKFPVKWSTSSPAIATVNEKTGEVTAVAPGAVTITAKAGPRTGQMALTVMVPVARVTISPNPVTMEWNTQDTAKVTLTVTAFDASGAPITDLADRSIVWASGDPTTATVAATDQPAQERVTGVMMGKTTVSVTVDGVRGAAPLTVQPEGGYFNNGGYDQTLNVGDATFLKMNFVSANGERSPVDEQPEPLDARGDPARDRAQGVEVTVELGPHRPVPREVESRSSGEPDLRSGPAGCRLLDRVGDPVGVLRGEVAEPGDWEVHRVDRDVLQHRRGGTLLGVALVPTEATAETLGRCRVAGGRLRNRPHHLGD